VIDRETAARIRHLHFAEHWRVGTIASELGLHHETVRGALQSVIRPLPPPRARQVDPYVEFIRQTLEQHPQLRATRLFQMIQERGFSGTARQVRRKVAEIRPRRQEAFLRRRVFPGEEGQADWASFGKVTIGTAQRDLSCFVMTLSYSRALYLEFSFDQRMESFLRGHIRAFADLGGVPRVILYDNLRSAVVERLGNAVHFNPRLIELAAHYHFAPRACRPARGNEKGRVERIIRFIRDSFFAARPFTTLTDFNRQALLWRSDVAAKRPWPQDDRISVEAAFAEEVLRLMELPVHPFDADFMGTVRSAKTIYVRFDKNDYSIPHSFVGRPLTLLASDWEVRILDGSTQVARHRRSYGRHERIEDQAHVDALLLEKARALASTPSSLLISVVPEVETFLEEGFKRGESAALMTTRLRLLLDDYGAQDLRAAVQEALLKGTPRTASVAYILGQQKRQSHRQAAPVDLSRRPDLKDLYVKPHAPETYDALSHSHDDDGSERD
jgi:transposase